MTSLSLDPVFDRILLVVAVALVLLLLLAIGPPSDRASGPRRLALAALRLGVIALVILAMLRPVVVATKTIRQSATLVILIDASRSMTVPDAVGGKTRWEALRAAIADAEDALADLAGDFEVKVYAFDAKTRALEIDGGKIALEKIPKGEQTAIAAALQDVIRNEAGKRLLAVVLLSDGAERSQAPRDVPPRTAVTQLNNTGAPLFTVAFGQSRGLGEAKDVAVEELLANQTVFIKNELAISGRIRVDGYVNRPIRVRALFENEDGRMEEVDQTTVTATRAGTPLEVELKHVPTAAGEFKLTLEVSPQDGELVTTNNRLSTFVNVLDGGLSVLYLEGTLRPEATFLQRALNASPDVNVRYNRIDAQQPETRPGDLPECMQPGKFDVYILGDLDAKAFEGNELSDLKQAVREGAGLIMIGGTHSFAPGGYADTPLRDVLPVVMNKLHRQSFDEPIRPDVHIQQRLQMRPTQVGLFHSALELAGSREENASVWSQLPPLDGANKFQNDAFARGAVVLADAGPRVPLLVEHFYGSGRVMAFAADSTWRWWMHGYQSAHKRFWRQIVLRLAQKDKSGNVWVRLHPRRYPEGAKVQFTVGARSSAGMPLSDARFNARIVLPNGTERPLELIRQGTQMIGSFRHTQAPGDYRIVVDVEHADLPKEEGQPQGEATGEGRFMVFEQDLELDKPAADADLLENLAEMTAKAGGKRIAPEQLSKTIAQLARQTEHLKVEEQTKETFWDKWPFFLMLVLLLSVEWFLRKRWGLV
ncbi:MAG: hypothetical protein HQ567_24910 [Candidatus Nealsonbacteria bacterium]|nr:hypothetical protein [Candidatus Nealsonbacteria bacterium]